MPNVPITITVFTNRAAGAKVSPDPATIRTNDQAVWQCADKFTVTFKDKGKPFKNKKFDKGKNKSGKPTGKAGKYKYTVKVGETTIDPRVIIP